MLKNIVVLLVILSVFLAACSSAGTQLPTEPTAVEVESETAVTEIPPLPEVTPTSDNQQVTELAEANCTVISLQPTPGPTEQSLVPSVTNEDWTQGPADARVTFIEYGDFQ
mgnify:FL=1